MQKNNVSCFKRILEEALHQAADVRLLTTHLTNDSQQNDMQRTADEATFLCGLQ